MQTAQTVIFYTLAFLSLYVQVFLLVTFFEKKKEILIRKKPIKLLRYPSVTVIVPCYNEEDTIAKTVRSLFALHYPKDKLEIILVDDGSTDGTWNELQKFASMKNVRAFRQANGGKHVAVNFGIAQATTELIGGLDSDSFVHPEALKRIATYFDDKETMAVCPSIIVHEPKNFLQKAQRTEYEMSIFTKKMLAFSGGIHVTPGPFSIFRKTVFDTIGPYKKAHNTEDQEIALRMHRAGYKIEHCPDAYVYTKSPSTIPKLYRQRLRWIYGFIKNAIDYRDLWFKPRYGTVGILTLPAGLISISSLIFLFFFLSMNIVKFAEAKINEIQAVGWHSLSGLRFEWFYFDVRATVFLLIALYAMVLFTLLMGRKMSHGRAHLKLSDLYFVIVYRLIAPFWIMKAIWNAAHSRESSWTMERKSGATLK